MERLFIVSDLHIGMGRDASGELDPQEDFKSEVEFRELVEHVTERGGHLVINGDWVDFLQIEPFEVTGAYESADGIPLLWGAEEALVKLETLFRTHVEHFAALEGLVGGGGKLTVIQGNHDPEWFFPAETAGTEPPLQKRLRARLGNPSEDVLRFEPTSLQVGGVHIEHGHQRCEPMNAFQRHPNIFHRDRLDRRLRVEYLWGSRFVVEFFNGLERRHPYADNLKPRTRALWLGIRNGWVGGKVAADFVGFLWGAGMPWRDLPEILGPQDAIELVQRVPDDDLRAMLVGLYQEDAEFREALDEKLDAGLAGRAVAGERTELGREEVVAETTVETLGLFRKKRELRQAKELLEQPGLIATVFGHTHGAVDGNAADVEVGGYFNTGTWTPSFDLRREENRRRLREADFPVEVLSDRDAFTLRLTYIEVTPGAGVGGVRLKEWPQRS